MSDDSGKLESVLGRPPFPPIEIDADGTWTHRGQAIEHDAILAELKRHLHRDSEGRYWIEMAPAPVPVNVGLAPYRVIGLMVASEPRLHLDDGTSAPLGAVSALTCDASNRLFCRVKPAGE